MPEDDKRAIFMATCFFTIDCPMQIATWNVNSLRIRLDQVLAWLDANPDVLALALQETKQEDSQFPLDAFTQAGLHVSFSGQKTYNGVAWIAREPLQDIQANLPQFPDPQKRLLAVTCAGIRLICVYIPNGQEPGSEKFAYKLNWLAALQAYVAEQQRQYPQLALLGDFNIAPEDRDVYDPQTWEGHNLVSPPERAAFAGLLEQGMVDAFRLFTQPERSFSWWDYRAMGFRRNAGLRIDHILLSKALAETCQACHIDREPRKHERPSDHTPVVATLTLRS